MNPPSQGKPFLTLRLQGGGRSRGQINERRAPTDLEKKNLLITGLPGVGKTTLMRKVYEALKNFHPVGFYTAEIREEGMRKGLELISLEGKRGILSHVDIKSPYRVGRYKVDVRGFEDFLERDIIF